MAMTMLDTDLLSLQRKLGSFSKHSILILLKKERVNGLNGSEWNLPKRSMNAIHLFSEENTSVCADSKGIINQAIKPDNIMGKHVLVYRMRMRMRMIKSTFGIRNDAN